MLILKRVLGIFFLLLAAYLFMSGGYGLTNIILRPLLVILGVFLFMNSYKKIEGGNESPAKINRGSPFLLMLIGFIGPIAYVFLVIFNTQEYFYWTGLFVIVFWTFSFLLASAIIGLARIFRKK